MQNMYATDENLRVRYHASASGISYLSFCQDAVIEARHDFILHQKCDFVNGICEIRCDFSQKSVKFSCAEADGF